MVGEDIRGGVVEPRRDICLRQRPADAGGPADLTKSITAFAGDFSDGQLRDFSASTQSLAS